MESIRRSLELENGNVVHFTTDPRTSFWRISFDKGGIPKELSGLYTDYKDAVYAAETYLARREKNKTQIKEKVK